MGKTEWAMWANEQAFASSFVMILGGIVGLNASFNFTGIAVYSLLAGIFVLLLEYPRGKRQKGTTIKRKFQNILTKIVKFGGPVTSNYYIRFLFHFLVCIPCFIILPTIMGGLCLFLASGIYLKAGICGESWQPVGLDDEGIVATSGS